MRYMYYSAFQCRLYMEKLLKRSGYERHRTTMTPNGRDVDDADDETTVPVETHGRASLRGPFAAESVAFPPDRIIADIRHDTLIRNIIADNMIMKSGLPDRYAGGLAVFIDPFGGGRLESGNER